MPVQFKDIYPSTFVIIDPTEIHVKVLASPSLQSQNYSAYKLHTTHKNLIGIAPNGCINFYLNCLLAQSAIAVLLLRVAFLIE